MTLNSFCLIFVSSVLCFIKPITAGGFCADKVNGDYKDPNNCYGFISCSNGLTYHMNCPAGLRFNERADKCDYPENVPCRYFCQGRVNGDYKDPDTCYGFISCSNGIAYKMPCPAGLRFNEKTDKCDDPKNVPCALDHFCDGKVNGVYKDPDNCYGFITCSNGTTYKMPCPAGMRFNEHTDKCDYPKNVPSCGNFCDGKPNGDYTDPDTCYGFISCSNGITYKMPCPAGLRFNEKKDECDYSKNVPCGPVVDGGWSPWYPWSRCTVSCGGGTQFRFRTCTNPPPANGGKRCVGPHVETRACATPSCPFSCRGKPNGDYKDPDNCYGFISCSNGIAYKMPCPAGLRFNEKKDECDSPENVPCGPVVNGGWSAWRPWSPCSVSCGGGTQIRVRTCTNPPPTNGGKPCVGPRMDRHSCATKSCPFSCCGKPNGDYKDPDNCYGFISCSNGIAYHMPCPAGLKFNAVKDKCDWPQNVKC